MTWVIIIVWTIALLLNFYCGFLYLGLYNTGITNESGRISLGKLNRALNNKKTQAQTNDIRYCKQCYIAFLCLFYIGIVGAVIEVIYAAIIAHGEVDTVYLTL